MHAVHNRACLAVGGLLLACCGGCTQPNASLSPGSGPDRKGSAREPAVNATTYFAHGHLLERQGSFERAVKQYTKALELAPEFVTARNRLGITLNKLGRHAEASAAFCRALEIKPGLGYLHNNLGFSLYLEGDYAAAEAATRRALEITPTFPRARMNHALALAKLHRFDEAFDDLCLVGSEADAYYNMAMLQTEAQLYAEASRSLDMALRLNPNLEEARQQLREIAALATQQETIAVADVTTDAATGPGVDTDPAPSQPQPEPPAETEASPPPVSEPGPTTLSQETGIAETPEPVSLFEELEPPDWFDEPAYTLPPATEDQSGEFSETDAPLPAPDEARFHRPYQQETTASIRTLIAAIVDHSEMLVADLWCELETHLDETTGRPAPP